MTEQEFSLKVNELKSGYAFWKDFVKNYQLSNNDYVIVFPHETDPVNKCGIAHLEQFMKYGAEETKQIILLCIGNEVPELVKPKSDKTSIRIKKLKKGEMESLVTLYSISTISSHFIMMSLTRPYGRYGDRALNRGATLDEVVTIGIYGMTEKEVFDKHNMAYNPLF